MATVFMKWLETKPSMYERGIRILTLGRLERMHALMGREYARPGVHVLELGCGSGELVVRLARAGAQVEGIDASKAMLAEAKRRIERQGVGDRVRLRRMDVTLIGERFRPHSFDLIVASLLFSELPPDVREYVLQASAGLLAPSGRLLILDEARPQGLFCAVLYGLVRIPLLLLTWLLTRTTTRALRDFDDCLMQAGFRPKQAARALCGSLVLYEAESVGEGQPAGLAPFVAGRLRNRTTVRSVLVDLWAIFFRIIPPYPKVRPGLYAVGFPGRQAPVLVTGNFDLTVRRVVRAIDGRVDAWLLVADSAGINVWCGAGGGYFTAEKVVAAARSCHLEQLVDHRELILPQLCAVGVDGRRLQHELGWHVRWGPVRADDIPAYLQAGCEKSDEMRWVCFPVVDRLEMVTVTLGFYGLLILLPVFIFWRAIFLPFTIALLGLSYFYALFHPWLPGKDGLAKSLPLTVLALGGFVLYLWLAGPLPALKIYDWGLGLVGLSVFVAAEMQGMSPLMRGEQANWGWEVVIAAVIGLLYWFVPGILGWR
jgi:ubiquinone/menaquinone biosynthesis C-methylase UbiE